MYYAYMDESWDLWIYWKKWNSRYFFITFLLTKEPRILEQTLKKTFKWMKNQKIINKWWVFHANNESQKTREKLLQYLAWKNFITVSYYIDKEFMQWASKDPHLLYNNIVIKLIKRCMDKNIILKWDNIQFYAARKETNKHLNKQFENQIKDELSWELNINVYLRYPYQEKGLQIVDSLAYAIYRKYENWYYNLYNIIKNNIEIVEQFPRK